MHGETSLYLIVTDKAADYIRGLVKHGTWGCTLEEVARRLIEERINQLRGANQ